MTMTSDEVWDLLDIIARIDRRKLGVTDRETWEGLVGDLNFEDCRAAVIAHFAESTEWLMPAHVRARVRAMRKDRLDRAIVPDIPPELADKPVRFRAELLGRLAEIADGRSVRKAIGGPVREDGPPPTWAEARAAMGEPPKLSPQEKARQQAAESRAVREAAQGEDPAA